jgi:hypothetical protein
VAWFLLVRRRPHRREPDMSIAIRIFDIAVVALIFTALT